MNVSRPSIFISHRHKDKKIADVFREAMEDWSNGGIKIFQSSHTETAIRIGDEIDDSIRKAIAESNLVLLIYTFAEDDWTWCMYECGLAQDPESLDTRIVVFQCSDLPPSPLKNLISVRMEIDSINTLADDFHRDPDFFPRCDRAIAPNLDEEQIEQRANELYQNLLKVVPSTRAQKLQRYDHITVAMPLEYLKEVQSIDSENGFSSALKFAKELIVEHCFIRNVRGEPQSHFNFEKITRNMRLNSLIRRWKQESKYSDIPWEKEVFEEMAIAMLNRKERGLSMPFNSLAPNTDAWFLPVLSHVRTLPDVNLMEFDILLCGIEANTAKRMIAKE